MKSPLVMNVEILSFILLFIEYVLCSKCSSSINFFFIIPYVKDAVFGHCVMEEKLFSPHIEEANM